MSYIDRRAHSELNNAYGLTKSSELNPDCAKFRKQVFVKAGDKDYLYVVPATNPLMLPAVFSGA